MLMFNAMFGGRPINYSSDNSDSDGIQDYSDDIECVGCGHIIPGS